MACTWYASDVLLYCKIIADQIPILSRLILVGIILWELFRLSERHSKLTEQNTSGLL